MLEYVRGFGRFQRNARLYLVSNALSGVTVGIILVLYNLYLSALGYGTDFIGLVLFVGIVGAGIAIFPAGLCIDRYGGKLILIWASVLISVAGAGQMLFRQPLPLLVSVFFAGIGGAFMVVVNAPFLSANSGPAERSLLFSLNVVISLATTVLGELLGGVLPVWLRAFPQLMVALPGAWSGLLVAQPVARSYQLALLISGLIAAPSFIPLFLMRADRPQQREQAQFPTHAAISLKSVHANLARLRATDWRAVLLSPLALMVAIEALLGLGAGLFLPYANLFFVKHLGASSALFGLIDGSANALNALLTLLAPLLVLRIGKVNTLTFTRLLSLPVMLLMGLTAWLPLAALLYPLRQGLMDMSEGILQVFSMEVVEKPRRGLANSSYQTAFQGTQALSTPLGGLIIAHAGYTPVFIAAALLYGVALALLWGSFGRGGRGDEKIEPAAARETTPAREVATIHDEAAPRIW
ncbi:MAG TPA: MFS transporter [Ktedonobacteraceae bacterium]|nr:MFS transporter [Ktedonobacteraceae bacterium]